MKLACNKDHQNCYQVRMSYSTLLFFLSTVKEGVMVGIVKRHRHFHRVDYKWLLSVLFDGDDTIMPGKNNK